MPFLSSIKYQGSSIKEFAKKNTKDQILNTKYRKAFGFTLIELLVVLGILAAAVGASLIFLTSVLKGNNQANVTAEVKQNGQVVLDSLEKQIRGATNATEMFSTGDISSGVILNLADSTLLLIACFDKLSTENGWIGVDNVSASTDITVLPKYDYQSITNQDPVSGVDVDCNPVPPYNLGFKVITSSITGTAAPAVVSISFVINQGIQAPSRADFLANAKFETTISLRNY